MPAFKPRDDIFRVVVESVAASRLDPHILAGY
jgi:hypothetical protein